MSEFVLEVVDDPSNPNNRAASVSILLVGLPGTSVMFVVRGKGFYYPTSKITDAVDVARNIVEHGQTERPPFATVPTEPVPVAWDNANEQWHRLHGAKDEESTLDDKPESVPTTAEDFLAEMDTLVRMYGFYCAERTTARWTGDRDEFAHSTSMASDAKTMITKAVLRFAGVGKR